MPARRRDPLGAPPIPDQAPNVPIETPFPQAPAAPTNPYANSADEFNRTLSATLLKRYGADFDLNDPNRGLAYFQRRRDETNAEGDPRDTAYWDMRASGVNEDWYAQQEAQNRLGTPPGWTPPVMTPEAPTTTSTDYTRSAPRAPLPTLLNGANPNDPRVRRNELRRQALLAQLS